MSNPKNVEIISTVTVTKRGGVVHRVKHASSSTGTDMTFAIFLPAVHKIGSTKSNALPAIYWLSGLTCTDQNFAQKAGGNAFAKADEGASRSCCPTRPRAAKASRTTTRTTSESAPAFISTPRIRRGISTTRWERTYPENFLGRWKRNGASAGTGAVRFAGTPWGVTVR